MHFGRQINCCAELHVGKEDSVNTKRDFSVEKCVQPVGKKMAALPLQAAHSVTCTCINTLFGLRARVCACVCVFCGWPSELQTGLLSAVTAHCHHNTLTPNTMLSLFPSPSLFMSLLPVLTTVQTIGYS